MNEKIKQLKEKQEVLRLEIQTESKKAFQEETAKIFVEFPEVLNFSWTQYTPYWNDGDACRFRVYKDYIEINGLEEYDFQKQKYSGEGKKISNPTYDPRLCEAHQKIKKVLDSLDDEFYETTFEDHKKVTVTPDGIKVKNHEHD